MTSNPYVLLAAGGLWIVSILGGYFYGTHHEALSWRAVIAEQKVETARTLNTATEAARQKETADADHAREIDAQHADALRAVADSRDAFADKLRIARSRQCGPSAPAGQAADTGSGATVASRGDDGPGQPDPGNRLREAVKVLQAYAVACHGWAVEVGR